MMSSNKILLLCRSVQATSVRRGHQMSTRNTCHAPKPKHRGIKRTEGEVVHRGDILVTQLYLRLHPGMNVGINWQKSLYAMCEGRVKITSEKFDPKFDHPIVVKTYEGREEQTIYKKYVNVIPHNHEFKFKLVDVV